VTERPGERRDNARTATAWGTVAELLERTPGTVLDIVDIGGGTGGFAVRAAEAGHRVAVVDPSPDALAALARRARERGVEVAGRQGDLAGLVEVVGERSADLVLCHGVLEMAPDAALALASVARVLRPGGHLSLLVAQRSAAVLARAMAGHFAQAEDLLDETGPIGRSGRRFTPAEAEAALVGAGFTVESVSGVRVFADLVPGSLLDLEPGATAALVALEQAVGRRPEYLPLATQLHLVARH
jgi:S-adenosylmethionine-dependent methyltransferase